MTPKTSLAQRTIAALAFALLASASCSEARASTDSPSTSSECPIDLANGVRCIAERAAPAVVSIRVTRNAPRPTNMSALPFSTPFELGPRAPQIAQGSGVIIRSSGYLATNAHVLEQAREVTVETSDGVTYSGEVVGADARSDVAVVKIIAKTALPYLTLADSDDVRPGDFTLAIGSPFGLDHSISFGVVSAIRRGGMGITDYEDFIQTDAAINPGNSGGALINGRGELIGINTAILSRSGTSAGVGFAVPSNVVRQIADQLIKEGKVTRGYLGVAIQDLTSDLRDGLGLATTKGSLIDSVEAKSPADSAGLKGGDVVVSVDGVALDSSRELRLQIARRAPGSTITLGIERESKKMEIAVTLADQKSVVSSNAGPAPSAAATPVLLGLELGPVSGQELGRFSGGAAVTGVETGSPASEAGLRPGDVIVAVGRNLVSSPEMALKLLEAHAGQASIVLAVVRDGRAQYVVLRVASGDIPAT